jgi:hypothetical protein
MLKVTFDQASLTRLTNTLKDSAKSIGREISAAINATAKQCSIKAARRLREEIKVPVRILKKAVKPGIKANSKNLTTILTLRGKYPIPLKYFVGKINPKLTKRQKTSIGTSFIVNKYKAHFFKRATNKRGPLVRQDGPAPADAFEKLGIAKLTEQTARDELPKQVDERIRVWNLRLQGKLRGNQK